MYANVLGARKKHALSFQILEALQIIRFPVLNGQKTKAVNVLCEIKSSRERQRIV